jgi:glycosyltransferase involved in cell wall biosynthesis
VQRLWRALAIARRTDKAVTADPVQILYLVDRYDGPHAGTERQLLQLIEGLDRSRFQPTVALLRNSGLTAHKSFSCPVEILGVQRLASVRSALKLIQCARRHRARGSRIVHCYFNDASLVAPIFRLFGMQVIVSRRDMGFWYTPFVLTVLRLVGPFVSQYVANSCAVKESVSRHEWVPPRKISVIYNGYRGRADAAQDSAAWRSAQAGILPCVPAGVPVIGLVANLRPIKRIDVLVEAMARICARQPDVRTVVVGADAPGPSGESMRDSLIRLAERLGVRDRIVFTGGVADASLYINRFSVAILCSESEGFSNALIEYMQAGRPIVCTRAGGNPELIEDGNNGFLVPVGDPDVLAARVILLLADDNLARRLGAAARETVRFAYTEAGMVSEQMSCYDRVQGRSHAARPAPAAVREA